MNCVKISNGNIKLGNIVNINLPPVISCMSGVPCASDKCYALKAYKMYPAAKAAWDTNLEIFQKDYSFYFSNIIDQLKKKKRLERFRWHSSGDLIDQNYLNGILNVANEFKNTKFLVYTKRNDIKFPNNLPTNLSIRFSMWKNFNNKTSLKNSSWISDDSRKPTEAFECPGSCVNCSECWKTDVKNIVFKKH